MITDRTTAKEGRSISMNADLWEMVDFACLCSGYKDRSDFITKAAEKQLIYQTKIAHMTDAYNHAMGRDIELNDMETVSFKIPKGMKRELERHCYNFGCSFEHQFGNIAVFKYLLMKEAHPELMDEYFRQMREGHKSFFKAIII